MGGLYATEGNDSIPGTAATATQVGGNNGDSFGPYRILYPVGQGGMGTVYLALQDEPIRRRVALKVIRSGMDSKDVLARFRREGQALALMEHTSIARIYDAGTSAEGRPYLVMEYVDGTPITTYCDQRRLPLERRLELFLTVCQAVHHAHQKGIIHRDIKPSNILVAEQDGHAIPKVIDFGIAKPTSANDDTAFTQNGQMVGTPQYASPEQADVLAGEVGAASDVYSLGVLFYELLVGTVPFDPDRLKQAGLAEMLRIIREEDPPSLASQLTASGIDAKTIADRRDTNPTTLRKRVEHDLDWIVHKALEKSPARRYMSVEAFASDVSRFLKGEPVEAAPPSAMYRAVKALRRNRMVVAAVAGAALAAAPLLWVMWPRTPKLTGKDSIVISDFSNSTGDGVFDGALREGLTTQLSQSPYLVIQPDQKINGILRQMEKAPGTKLTPEVAREVCQRMGSTAVAEGSIAPLGSAFVLGLRLRNCHSDELLDSEQTQVARKEDVLKALSEIAKTLRSRAGESLSTVEKYSKPLEATTASLEALQAYSEGRRAHISGKPEARQLLARAIELDPKFAMAYAMLAQSYDTKSEFDLAAVNLRKAYDLRDRVADHEGCTSPRSMKGRCWGTWRRRGKPANCGHRPIRGRQCHTASCPDS
jgi:serine/threonine protein kinase